MPYRVAPRVAPSDGPPRFAWPSMRMRVGADCFDLSGWDSPLGVTLLFVWIPLVLALVLAPSAFTVGLIVVPIMACATGRVRFVATRATSWAEWRVLGICRKRVPLGRAPTVADCGYDWSEVAVLPADESLRRGLHDNERVVLAEWTDWQVDTREIIAALRTQIARLHDVR